MFTDLRYQRGFTLFEVMMAVAIVAMIAGSLLVMVQTMTSSTADVYQINSRYDQGLSLMRALRTQFHNLPPQAVIQSLEGGNGETGYNGLIISNGPSIFRGNHSSARSTVTILREEAQANGQKQLVAIFPGQAALDGKRGKDLKDEPKVVLLNNIKSMEWGFAAANQKGVLTNWVGQTTRPVMIMLNLQLSDLLEPVSGTFYLPRTISISPLSALQNNAIPLKDETEGPAPQNKTPAPQQGRR